jgi:hypothetical protein
MLLWDGLGLATEKAVGKSLLRVKVEVCGINMRGEFYDVSNSNGYTKGGRKKTP